MRSLLLTVFALVGAFAFAADDKVQIGDAEVWNLGVDFYRSGDVTNALAVMRPLMLSRSHGARAAEVVAKLEYERDNFEEAAAAAQIALRARPDDAKANRNFTRTVDRLPQLREEKHIQSVLKAAEGRSPDAILRDSAYEARALMREIPFVATNRPERQVALADAYAKRAGRLADSWLPVRQAIVESVTNEETAATILGQLDVAKSKGDAAAQKLADLDDLAYVELADTEHDFTRFFKMVALPPSALAEGKMSQSNACIGAEMVNDRPWQQEALEYTRVFRSKFPAWARAYEQQAQNDTNCEPFTAETQAKISALATELEKLQLECVEHQNITNANAALELVAKIDELMPKDRNGNGDGQNNQQNQPQNQNRNQQGDQDKQNQQSDQSNGEQQLDTDERQEEDPDKPSEDESEAEEGDSEESEEDKEVESVLRKAQERNDEHEADKKARMRKAVLPPNERDW